MLKVESDIKMNHRTHHKAALAVNCCLMQTNVSMPQLTLLLNLNANLWPQND